MCMTCVDGMLYDVYGMSCVDDAGMLCSVVLFIMLIDCCMAICNYVLRAGLLFIIGCDKPLRTGGRFGIARRNMFGRGCFSLFLW